MSSAVATFININISCKAAMNSGCDVTAPFKKAQQYFITGLLFYSLSVLLLSLQREFPAQLGLVFSLLCSLLLTNY